MEKPEAKKYLHFYKCNCHKCWGDSAYNDAYGVCFKYFLHSLKKIKSMDDVQKLINKIEQ